MRERLAGFRSRLAAAVIVGVGAVAFANAAQAESCCGGGQPPLSAQAVTDFEHADKKTYLQDHPNLTGGALTAEVRDLLLSDSGTLDSVMELEQNADGGLKASIAAGLAQAARLWLRGDPTFAQLIQQRVADTKDNSFIVAYSNAAGNQPIGAVGAGAGSAGGPGGQTNGLGGGPFGTGGVEGIGGNGVNTGSFSMTGGTTGSGSVSQ
jgi:hypothetical protein